MLEKQLYIAAVQRWGTARDAAQCMGKSRNAGVNWQEKGSIPLANLQTLQNTADAEEYRLLAELEKVRLLKRELSAIAEAKQAIQ